MKHILVAIMVVVLSSANISAKNYYQSLCSRISGLGRAIEKVDTVPVIGKLTNVLPMAALAASLKECPMQTMVVLTALGAYVLSQNEAVREILDKYEIMNNVPWLRRNRVEERPIDESIFVFDGDEEEIEILEDDLLGSDLLGEGSEDMKKTKRNKSS